MTARRFLTGCAVAAAGVVAAVLGMTAWVNHQFKQDHNRARGGRP